MNTYFARSGLIFICLIAGLSAEPVSEQNKNVVFIHGILAKPIVWHKMEQRFEKAGYRTFEYGYPSTSKGIQEHGNDFAVWLHETFGSQPFYLISHSMGNLVSREALASDTSLNVIRWVMLAPPNQGADVADLLNRLILYRWITRDAGQDLLASQLQHYMTLPPPSMPFGIIAGGKGDDQGYNPFLAGDDDGEVRVAETYLPGSADHILVKHAHTTMLWYDDTFLQAESFINNGHFIHQK